MTLHEIDTCSALHRPTPLSTSTLRTPTDRGDPSRSAYSGVVSPRRWHHQIINWHQARVSNDPAETVNDLSKRVKRTALGFRRFTHYRIRALLYTGKPMRCSNAPKPSTRLQPVDFVDPGPGSGTAVSTVQRRCPAGNSLAVRRHHRTMADRTGAAAPPRPVSTHTSKYVDIFVRKR